MSLRKTKTVMVDERAYERALRFYSEGHSPAKLAAYAMEWLLRMKPPISREDVVRVTMRGGDKIQLSVRYNVDTIAAVRRYVLEERGINLPDQKLIALSINLFGEYGKDYEERTKVKVKRIEMIPTPTDLPEEKKKVYEALRKDIDKLTKQEWD